LPIDFYVENAGSKAKQRSRGFNENLFYDDKIFSMKDPRLVCSASLCDFLYKNKNVAGRWKNSRKIVAYLPGN
jgi:hypothetical protein